MNHRMYGVPRAEHLYRRDMARHAAAYKASKAPAAEVVINAGELDLFGPVDWTELYDYHVSLAEAAGATEEEILRWAEIPDDDEVPTQALGTLTLDEVNEVGGFTVTYGRFHL